MYIRKLSADELAVLSELFDYADIDEMIKSNSKKIADGTIDIFCLFEGSRLVGELRARYKDCNPQIAIRGQRAYLYAFRIHKDFQGKGLGKHLMETVLSDLTQKGYREFTIGVEDDNNCATHIYKSFGFNHFVTCMQEEYQGDKYQYNLYLKK